MSRRRTARHCRGKVRNPTTEQARAQMWAMVKRGASVGSLHVYHCPSCRHLHVGRIMAAQRRNFR